MQIVDACRAIKDSKTISKQQVMANSLALYTSCMVPKAVLSLLNKLPIHLILYPALVPLGLPALLYF